MSQIWPTDVIRELLALADANGHSSAVLSSPLDARRFRFAIYNFRRSTNLGYNITIIIDGAKVIATRKQEHQVTLAEATMQLS